MGYGIIEVDEDNAKLIASGIIDLNKLNSHAEKLKKIFERTNFLIDEFKPECMAVEAPFFGKNVQSMLKLGRAQGVAFSAALANNLEVFEYSPKKVKQSVTGNGNASKEQVAAMLQQILNFSLTPKYLDATDGLAVALCHHYQDNKIMGEGKSYSGWKSFVDQNPDKTI